MLSPIKDLFKVATVTLNYQSVKARFLSCVVDDYLVWKSFVPAWS